MQKGYEQLSNKHSCRPFSFPLAISFLPARHKWCRRPKVRLRADCGIGPVKLSRKALSRSIVELRGCSFRVALFLLSDELSPDRQICCRASCVFGMPPVSPLQPHNKQQVVAGANRSTEKTQHSSEVRGCARTLPRVLPRTRFDAISGNDLTRFVVSAQEGPRSWVQHDPAQRCHHRAVLQAPRPQRNHARTAAARAYHSASEALPA